MLIEVYDNTGNMLYVYCEYGFEISYGENKLTLANGNVFFFSSIVMELQKNNTNKIKLVMV